MPNYVVTGRNTEGYIIASVSVSQVDQDGQVTDDMTFVNAARNAMAAGNGIASVVVQKYDQIITIV